GQAEPSSMFPRSRAMLYPMKIKPARNTRPKTNVPMRLGPRLSFACITVDADAAAMCVLPREENVRKRAREQAHVYTQELLMEDERIRGEHRISRDCAAIPPLRPAGGAGLRSG